MNNHSKIIKATGQRNWDIYQFANSHSKAKAAKQYNLSATRVTQIIKNVTHAIDTQHDFLFGLRTQVANVIKHQTDIRNIKDLVSALNTRSLSQKLYKGRPINNFSNKSYNELINWVNDMEIAS